MLWPQRLLDAATGDTMCGLHDVGPVDRACLRCLFPVATVGPDAAQRLSEHLGIDASVLRHGDQPLRSEHIAHLDEPHRRALTAELGKPICGLARATGLTDLPSNDYRPSVPFVSQQAPVSPLAAWSPTDSACDARPSCSTPYRRTPRSG